MMTWCMFERFGKSTNKVALFNCHFDHESMTSRQYSAKIMIQTIESLVPADHFIIVTGDFNGDN